MKYLSIPSFLLLCGAPAAADGGLLGSNQIGDFDGLFADNDRFGSAVERIGDFNGDGVEDVAVGEPFDDEGGSQKGAVWLLYMNANGTVGSYDKIVSPATDDHAGESIANLGDLDGNGVVDLALGSVFAEEVNILFLNADATVASHVTIEGTDYTLSANPDFGAALAGIDFDGDGRRELVVSAPDEFPDPKLFVFSLDAGGGILGHHVVSEGVGGFTGTGTARLGASLAPVGDVDSDGVYDLVAGDPEDVDGGTASGAVWVLFMKPDGTVRDQQKISATEGGLNAPLATHQEFGWAVGTLGNFDGGGGPDLLVTDSPLSESVVWQLFLNPNGTVRSYVMHPESSFGSSAGNFDDLTSIDLNGDGVREIVVGNENFAGGGTGRGAIHVLVPPTVVRGARTPYGCDLNPLGSLVPTSPPAIGTTMTFEVNNPLDTQTHGETFPVLVASFKEAGECGVAIDGWNMDPNLPSGELLVLPLFELSILGDVWNGPKSPVTIGMDLPQDPCLIGGIGYVQAAMVDFSDDAIVPIGLTRAWKLRLGT